eukprot:TRINITY_DN8458_c0_g1_i4.p2 TRINITY_DN8458_c0_g1~~TRINITY_DN8458_c0_g1_i4.p2  ORF type:complete len:286 (+),score=95.27 TRINITY_DN8458_c0_g1_i4:604-1461(+)
MTVADLKANEIRMLRLAYAIQETRKENAQIDGDIRDLLERQQGIRSREARCAALRHRIATLTGAVQKKEQALHAEQQAVGKQRQHLRGQLQQLSDAREQLRQRREQLREQRAELDTQRDTTCAELKACIATRRSHLVAGISQIYPLQFDKANSSYTIAKLKMSNANSVGCDDEAAAALGYVVHVLKLLAKIWGVELRYTLYPVCSRSYLRQDFIDQTSIIHALFHQRSNEKSMYFKAITLLNMNILQLLRVRGLPVDKDRHMLANLRCLLTEGRHADDLKEPPHT